MRAILIAALTLAAIVPPAIAAGGSCWRDGRGDILSFSDRDWTDVLLFKKGSRTAFQCGRAVGDNGPEMSCPGDRSPAPVGMSDHPRGPNEAIFDYDGRSWRNLPCKPYWINHGAL
jgi:hypothetical protein